MNFEGEIGTSSGTSIQAITHYNYATICRGGNSIIEKLKDEIGDNYTDYINFYGLRNWGELHGKLTTELIYVHRYDIALLGLSFVQVDSGLSRLAMAKTW